jgi:hypothetical protein
LTFSSFSTEKTYDYLQVNSPLFDSKTYRLSGRMDDSRTAPKSDRVYCFETEDDASIDFHSDASITYQGFALTYEFADDECGSRESDSTTPFHFAGWLLPVLLIVGWLSIPFCCVFLKLLIEWFIGMHLLRRLGRRLQPLHAALFGDVMARREAHRLRVIREPECRVPVPVLAAPPVGPVPPLSYPGGQLGRESIPGAPSPAVVSVASEYAPPPPQIYAAVGPELYGSHPYAHGIYSATIVRDEPIGPAPAAGSTYSINA